MHFLDPTWEDTDLSRLPAVGAITEPLAFTMLDGIDEQGAWTATARLNDIQVRGGQAFLPPLTLPPQTPTVMAEWDFSGGTPKDPTSTHASTTADTIDDTFIGSFSVGSPGYATDPVATVLPQAFATTPSLATTSYFTIAVTIPQDVKPVALKMRVSRTTAATPTGFYVTASYDGWTKKLPILTSGPLAGTNAPTEAVPTQRTSYTAYSINLADVPRQASKITLRVHVFSPTPATDGLDFDQIELWGTSYPQPLVGRVVRINVGTIDGSSAFGKTDDVFYGIVDSYAFSGVSENSLEALVQLRGRGLRDVFQHQIVAPPAASPKASSRLFTTQNPGQIWGTLRDEAIARGLPKWPQATFDGSTDSAGNAWTLPVTLSVQVGSTLDDLLRAFSELGFEVTMTRDRLNVYDGRAGTGSESDPVATIFDQAAQDQESFGPIRTVAYTRKADGSVEEASGEYTLNAYGRQETYIEAQRTEGSLLAQAALNRLGTEAIKISISYPYIRPQVFSTGDDLYAAPAPYKSYQLGDWVKVASLFFPGHLTRRVTAITLGLNPEGELTVTPELGDVRDDLDRRTKKLISKLEGGTGEGASVEFRDTVGSTAALQPVTQVTGATGVEGTILGASIQTVDQVDTYDSGTNLIVTVGGLTVANYTGEASLTAGDEIYVVNGEAAVGIVPLGS